MTKNQMPRWLIGAGAPLTLAVFVLAIRLVWEQTLQSWSRGPQMIGFSLMHGGAGWILIALAVAALLWFVITLIFAGLRRSIGGTFGLAVVFSCAMSFALILIPYSWWQAAFASKLAHGPHAAEFLSMSAAEGHERIVNALLENGVQVNARTRDESTALHAATIAGQMNLVQLLIERGADINAVDRYGDSPLASAESSGQREVAEYLRARGAQFVRGTDEQRSRAVREIVRQHSDRSR